MSRDLFGNVMETDEPIDFEASKEKKEMVKLTGAVFPITQIEATVEELKAKIRAQEGNDDMEDIVRYVNSEIEREKEDETKKLLARITGKEIDEDVFELSPEAKKMIRRWTHNESEKLELDPETKKLEQEIMGNTVQYMEKAQRKKAVKELIKELQEEE